MAAKERLLRGKCVLDTAIEHDILHKMQQFYKVYQLINITLTRKKLPKILVNIFQHIHTTTCLFFSQSLLETIERLSKTRHHII